MRILWLLCALMAAPAHGQSLLEWYQRGVGAAGEGRNADYLAAMDSALALAPELAVLHRHRAQALALLERGDEAMAELRLLVAWGIAFEPAEREAFASLRDRDDWPALLAEYAASREPTGSMDATVEIQVDGLIPEGIAYDAARDRFLVSSIAQRAIYQVELDGSAKAWIAPRQHGYLAGLGLAVDAVGGRLWAVSDAQDDSVNFAPDEIGRSAVHVFELESGVLLWSFFSEAADSQSYNDVVVLPDGHAVVSAAASGSLWRFDRDGGAPTRLATPGSVPGANGLCLADGARELYVSAYVQGIVRVDLESGAVRPAYEGREFTTAGVDGLYRVDDRLLAIQNAYGLDRVVFFELAEDGSIASAQVVVARQPIFLDPTTGALREGRFHFLANSQVEPYLNREDRASAAGFARTKLASIVIR